MKIVCSERISKLPHQFLDPLQSDVVNQLVIFGQISKIRGFEEPNIFVQYQTFLPSGWKHEFDSKNISSKYTQTTCCELELKTNFYVGRLGVPIELSLCSGEPLGEIKPPKLYFKVWSIDSMDRQRIQGYGCLVLPTTAGPRNYTIQTWKPKQHFQSQLTSYFLGGSPDLIEFNFNELENVESNNHYGFQTQTSGSVSFSLNCILRSRLKMLTRREMIESQEEYVVESAAGASTKAALQRAKLRLKALKAFANNEDPTVEEP